MLTPAQTAVMARMKGELEAAGIAQLDAAKVVAYIESHPTLKAEMQAAFPLDDVMAEPEAAVVADMIVKKKRFTVSTVSEAMVEAYASGSDEVKLWVAKAMKQANNSYDDVLKMFKSYYTSRGVKFDTRGFFVGTMHIFADLHRVTGWVIQFVFDGIAYVFTITGKGLSYVFEKIADGIDRITKRDDTLGLRIVQ
jgi:hypothetical protein